ncbi:MAG: hypothetical protein BZY88_20160 [SAR202 cluster bacterium Io17-Chloro-G9]|nr:MAG: hypothetical protein BZY88_20160 [SAR202 cluster bacterium Io17-Chloro-G9]
MVQLKGEAKQQYVANLFSRIAGRYDLMNDLMTWGMHRRWKHEAARIAIQDLVLGVAGDALDVATGTGDLSLALARRSGINRVVGVDLLPGMIDLAKSKTAAAGLSGCIEYVTGDALALPFPDNTFVCCIAGFSLRNMPGNQGADGIQQAVGEMARVVRPDGRVVTLELTPMARSGSSAILRLYFRRIVPVMGHIVAGNKAAYTYLPESVDNFPAATQLEELFQDAGLVSVGFKTMGLGAVAVHWGSKSKP